MRVNLIVKGTFLALLAVAGSAPARAAQSAKADPPAEVRYRSIDVLKGVPSSQVPGIMKAWSKALGVPCQRCHDGERYELPGKPEYLVARHMARMVAAVSTQYLQEEGGVTCWSCHRGAARPSRLPMDTFDSELAKWPVELSSAEEEHGMTMTVFIMSLGVSCEFCHEKARWKDTALPRHVVAIRMLSMFKEFPAHLGSRSGRMQCYTCHKGSTRVPRR